MLICTTFSVILVTWAYRTETSAGPTSWVPPNRHPVYKAVIVQSTVYIIGSVSSTSNCHGRQVDLLKTATCCTKVWSIAFLRSWRWTMSKVTRLLACRSLLVIDYSPPYQISEQPWEWSSSFLLKFANYYIFLSRDKIWSMLPLFTNVIDNPVASK